MPSTMAEKTRGSIAFFASYRPPLPLDVFSCPIPATSKHDELPLTDGVSYNYNGHFLPRTAIKAILSRPKIRSGMAADGMDIKEKDVDSGRVTGMVFVSEREAAGNLETLHIALRFQNNKVKVFNFADVYDTFKGVRMEDSGCVAGDYLVYVSTKDPAAQRRQSWTAVYKTNLKTGKTERITAKQYADLSPSVSPSGKMIAVASYQGKAGGWDGEIEDLKTNICVMNVEGQLMRKLVVKNGGWPTWGSDNVLFFHRKVEKNWGVFRFDIRSKVEARVTPDGIDGITPAAVDENKVAVATIRRKSEFSDVRVEAQYRHIEIFEYSTTGTQRTPVQITQKIRTKADHYNPFVIADNNGGKRIGYHRVRSELLEQSNGDIPRQFYKLECPYPDVDLFRVSGVFPTFSKDGSKLAFVDNEFKAVWVADSEGLRIVYETEGVDNVFSPVWNQDPEKDILYICSGPSFHAKEQLLIRAIPNVSSGGQRSQKLTRAYNNAFPSTNPEGTKLVFRSTRDSKGDKIIKNLYIMEDAQSGEFGRGKITRLTEGDWTDTQCQWSPSGDWILFSSTRDKPTTAPQTDNGLDPGYFSVFLVKPDDPSVVVRVVGSGNDLAGHVNHPFFSPDGKSIVVTADLAAVSVDPMSLPLFLHSVRPYGDIFIIDIDPKDINKNKNVKKFDRVTHSRYESAVATWTMFSTQDHNASWNLFLTQSYSPACPYAHSDGGESWHMTGHLCIPKRCC